MSRFEGPVATTLFVIGLGYQLGYNLLAKNSEFFLQWEIQISVQVADRNLWFLEILRDFQLGGRSITMVSHLYVPLHVQLVCML